MSDIQSKITRHAKKQEIRIFKQMENQSIETRTDILELADKNTKTIIITVFSMFKKS